MWKSVAFLLVLFHAQPAIAEVSDKIPSQPELWGTALLVGLAGLAGGILRPLLGLAVGAFAAFLSWGAHEILADPHVGPAAIAEQGQSYWWSVYGSSGLMLAMVVAGVFIGLRRQTARERLRHAV